jgi:hypothetical protein
MKRAKEWLLALALTGVAACCWFDDPDECENDDDCALDELCVHRVIIGSVCRFDDTSRVVPDIAVACSDSRQCEGYDCLRGRCATRCLPFLMSLRHVNYGCENSSMCASIEGEEFGVCIPLCYDDLDCHPGFVCELEPEEIWGECVLEGADVPETTCFRGADCGDYTCENGTCFSFCLDSEQCRYGGECEIPDGASVGSCPPVWTWLAVVSTAAGDESLASDTPGPDIDAVELVQQSTVSWATSVLAAAEGSVTGGRALTGVPENVLAAPDDFTTPGGDCALDDALTTFAMGGAGGFVVVSFDGAASIEEGASVRVIELASGPFGCGNIATERPDSFEVYLGRGDAPGTASEITGTWCRIGVSSRLGGVAEFIVNTATCD